MSLQSYRGLGREAREPTEHELDPIRCEGQLVPVRLTVRRAEDGAWRGRLRFTEPGTDQARETAEILCGPSEEEFWRSVQDLREHHLRDLYRSLV